MDNPFIFEKYNGIYLSVKFHNKNRKLKVKDEFIRFLS